MKKYKNFWAACTVIVLLLAAAQLGEEWVAIFCCRYQWWSEHEFRQLQPENQTEHLEHVSMGGYFDIYVPEKYFQDDDVACKWK